MHLWGKGSRKENQFWPCDAFYLHFFLVVFGFFRFLEINIFCKLEPFYDTCESSQSNQVVNQTWFDATLVQKFNECNQEVTQFMLQGLWIVTSRLYSFNL